MEVTKRDVYYMDTNLFIEQKQVDWALDVIARIEGVPSDSLGIISRPNGLAYGSLFLSTIDYKEMVRPAAVVDAEVLIFPDVVLIVEKEAVFHTLQQEHCKLEMETNNKLLLVTGKGYPSMATRRFLHWLYLSSSRTRFYVLVDYDPYGYEIALHYRLGGAKPSELALQDLQLLGVLRGQLDAQSGTRDGSRHELGKREKQRRKGLEEKARLAEWADMERALKELYEGGFGTEIESLNELTNVIIQSFKP